MLPSRPCPSVARMARPLHPRGGRPLGRAWRVGASATPASPPAPWRGRPRRWRPAPSSSRGWRRPARPGATRGAASAPPLGLALAGAPPWGGPWRRAGGKVAGGQRRGRGWPAAPGNGRRHPRGGCQNRGAVRPSVVPSAVAAGVEWAGVHPDKRRRRRVRRRSLRVYPVSHQIRKTENRFNGRGCGRCPRPHTYGTVQY